MAPNVNIFRENGVPESNIITFLQTQPRASFVNPVLFRELVEEVKEMGFNPSTMKFAEALHVLQAMSKSTWERKFNAYQKWGLSGDRICLAFRRNPWCMAVSEDKIMRINFLGILQRNIETCVAPNINIFRENGVSESNIITLLQCQPNAFLCAVRFREIVEEVKEMGFNPLRLKFALAVFTLRAISKSTLERKVNVYKKWGWSEDEIYLTFRRHQWCMMASEDKIMRVMDFYVNNMGMESSLLIKNPELVNFNLEKRLIPRGLVFQVLLSKGLVKKVS
ncbi:hypothetical protein RGQ29_023821 [Quercus rubra]|uniref:Uncharacterized protein n=1 Tax=Quercus rubra TaxID=3512 RepID=A0AAN7F8T2_QUERU|nr:hypothetical protein RGQ29_023821 [Quercus rubra]